MYFVAIAGETPEFDRENGFVIDTEKIKGGQKDSINIVDKLLDENCVVHVFGFVENEWKELGSKQFFYFDDDLHIKSEKDFKLSAIRYFAVQLEGNVKFVCKAEKKVLSLTIEIRNEGSDLSRAAVPKYLASQNSYTFSVEDLSGKTKDNIKVVVYAPVSQPRLFKISVYDVKKHDWMFWGTAKVKHTGWRYDSDNGDSKHKGLRKYKYIAIEPLDDQQRYNFIPFADDADIIINVRVDEGNSAASPVAK